MKQNLTTFYHAKICFCFALEITLLKNLKFPRQNFQVQVYTTRLSYFSLVSFEFSLFSPEGEVTSP